MIEAFIFLAVLVAFLLTAILIEEPPNSSNNPFAGLMQGVCLGIKLAANFVFCFFVFLVAMCVRGYGLYYGWWS